MSQLNTKDRWLLYAIARGNKRILEIGSGDSTFTLARGILDTHEDQSGCHLDTINILHVGREAPQDFVHYHQGWSVTQKEFDMHYENVTIHPSKYTNLPDDIYLDGGGPQDDVGLLRHLLDKRLASGLLPSMFFFDGGEYTSWADWNVAKSYIQKNSFIALHDTSYPKSVKSYRMVEEIKKSPKVWQPIFHSKSRCGLHAAIKVA